LIPVRLCPNLELFYVFDEIWVLHSKQWIFSSLVVVSWCRNFLRTSLTERKLHIVSHQTMVELEELK
jgi:hypothetical protein